MYIDSGSSVLNLALTGNVLNGWPLGRVSNLYGDRSSGKTLLAINAAASFTNDPPLNKKGEPFKEINVVYMDAEAAFPEKFAVDIGLNMDKVDLYSSGVYDITLESVYESICEICKNESDNTATLFILDSLDSIPSERESGEELSKGYGLVRQKVLSDIFRLIAGKISSKNVHLMFLSQIRENINPAPYAAKHKKTGGKAIDFFTSHIVKLSTTTKLKHSKTKLHNGVVSLATVEKNKKSAPFRTANLKIYYDRGVDNVQTALDYLVSTPSDLLAEGVSIEKSANGRYNYMNVRGTLSELALVIGSDEKMYIQLLQDLSNTWHNIEEVSKVERGTRVKIPNSVISKKLKNG